MDSSRPDSRSPRRPRARRARPRPAGPPWRTKAGTLARVGAVIAAVPRGRVITYGQAAEAAGFPRGARLAVRALLREEGLPWHRVVAAGGRIALAGEAGKEQRLRLALEGVAFRGGRVRMDVHGWAPRSARRPRQR